ncbi:MAG: dTDP-4-dehydrorhamnose reductase [Deltaproteobacteria bacterium]|nr:dTDP-4-dehydrorhamnose reductase [Deltaproteobacteria bacterium]
MGLRFFVTGKDGQLGRCLVRRLAAPGEATLVGAIDLGEVDVGDRDAVMGLFDDLAEGPPDLLVNAAAFTAVDRCESEPETAMRVNGEAPQHLAELCRGAGTRLVHVSTDYVFDGASAEPYDEKAVPAPCNAYGRSKLEGEQRVLAASPDFLVVRTSWLYGPGPNFVGAILRQARLRAKGEVEEPLKVVDDQHGCPTFAADLAEGLIALATAVGNPSGRGGLYHLCNAGATTWWDFARAILDLCGFGALEIERGRTRDLDLPAPRPAWSVLDCSRAAGLGVGLRGWREALECFLLSPDGKALVEGNAPAEGNA